MAVILGSQVCKGVRLLGEDFARWCRRRVHSRPDEQRTTAASPEAGLITAWRICGAGGTTSCLGAVRGMLDVVSTSGWRDTSRCGEPSPLCCRRCSLPLN